MSVLSIFKRKGLSGFGYGSTAEDITGDIDLKGQTILVTGTSSGLGLETVRVLAVMNLRRRPMYWVGRS